MPARSAMGTPARVSLLMTSPMMAATLSFSMRRLTALAASMRSLRVSTRTSSTGWPKIWGWSLMGHLDPFPDHLAHGRGRAGHGEIDADLDGGRGREGRQKQEAEHQAEPFHEPELF